jgi:hypothetical protein
MATPKPERPMLGVEDRVTIAYITTLLAEMDLRYQQRFDAANKAVEAAFMAQQTAMQTALTAAEKAVQSALSAAEKAVTKAEVAAEKRFDGVNEFRKAYQDIIALQMPRIEVENRLLAVTEKIDDMKRGFLVDIGELRKANYHVEGQSSGTRNTWNFIQSAIGMIVGLIVAYIALHKS